MAHNFDIIFEPLAVREARARKLDCVLTPTDRFTGQIITRRIEARIERQGAKARRSLSGHLYFENLFEAAPISIDVDTKRSGYFAPLQPIRFLIPQDPADPAQTQLLLDLRPERVIDGETAVVRGRVKRGTDGVADATVYASEDHADPAMPRFQTRTDKNGTYALRVRLTDIDPLAGAVAMPVTGQVDVWAEEGGAASAPTPVPVTDMATGAPHEITLP